MSLLIDFIEENFERLSKSELDVVCSGLRLMKEFNDRKIKELNENPRSEVKIEDLFNEMTVGKMLLTRSDRSNKERDSCDLLVLLWEYLMPHLDLMQREVVINDGTRRRIDILAKKRCGSRVIIELKYADSNLEIGAKEQVYGYKKAMDRITGKPHDILLINSTGVLSDECDVITWADLGIYGDFAHVPDSFDTADLASICECLNVYPKIMDGKLAYKYEAIWEYMHG